MNETVIEFLKPRWRISKATLKSLGIDPNSQWDNLQLRQLDAIAAHLQITVEELTKY